MPGVPQVATLALDGGRVVKGEPLRPGHDGGPRFADLLDDRNPGLVRDIFCVPLEESNRRMRGNARGIVNCEGALKGLLQRPG